MAELNTTSSNSPAVVELDGFTYKYPGAESYLLRDITFCIQAGECHLLTGPTGTGKTTLLKGIRDLLPQGNKSGRITFPINHPKSLTKSGLVQQNPKTQLLCSTLGAEIAFGLENHGVEPREMPARAASALQTVGLARPTNYPVDSLSMGQQYRACVAGQLVMNPHLVMLDEPMAQLDVKGRKNILALIRQLKNLGHGVLICEHRFQTLQGVIDRAWRLDRYGKLLAFSFNENEETNHDNEVSATTHPKVPSSKPITPPIPLLKVSGVQVTNKYGKLDLSNLNLEVMHGERLALCGANGSGKTTLIRVIAGLLEPTAGDIIIDGQKRCLGELRGKVAVLFQEPEKQLFEATVFEEIAFAAHRGKKYSSPEVAGVVGGILNDLGIGHLSQTSPHTLSYGQKHLVGLGAVLATSPQLLILDDPIAGLDKETATTVLLLLRKIASQKKIGILITSHDPETAHAIADRTVPMPTITSESGQEDLAVPSEIFLGTNNKERNYRMPTGAMLAICILLSMLAFGARTVGLLITLSSINLALILIYCSEPLSLLRKCGVFFIFQAALIMLLYIIRFGFEQGTWPGVQVAWQLFLAFTPGMIFMASNSQVRVVRTLAKLLPQRIAFVASTCLRFLPMLLSEMQQIREAQILRGARLMVSDLKNPRYWPDWLRCLLVPTLIKTLTLAGDIATAATARDFGIKAKRTLWPGE